MPDFVLNLGDRQYSTKEYADLTTSLSGYVPTSTTLTIHGQTQDLSTNRTFTPVFSTKTSNHTVTNSDRVLKCDGTFTVTLPLVASINHYDDIVINNYGTGVVTVDTTSGELMYDTSSIDLHGGESLTLKKGTGKYLVI